MAVELAGTSSRWTRSLPGRSARRSTTESTTTRTSGASSTPGPDAPPGRTRRTHRSRTAAHGPAIRYVTGTVLHVDGGWTSHW